MEIPEQFKFSCGDKVGIIACSNPLSATQRQELELLCKVLRKFSLVPVCSGSVLAAPGERSARRRAGDLMRLYRDPDIKAVFDVSGGDLANELLSYLDFDVIRKNPKPFFGYSDLTTIINALYQCSGQSCVLYQVRNLVGEAGAMQREMFCSALTGKGTALCQVMWNFLQGSKMEGTLIGGNLRCLLKLAGTPYFPETEGHLLFLESLGGGPEQITTYLCQLRQIGVFSRIAGLLLGTFTTLEKQIGTDSAISLLRTVVDCPDLPMAKTRQVGHAPDSRALVIGSRYACSGNVSVVSANSCIG